MATPLFATAPYVYVLLGVGLLLAGREVLVRRYLGAGHERPGVVDSIGVLWLATTPGTTLAVLVPFTGVAALPAPALWFWLGITTMLAGFCLRLAALLTLGETFTQHVAVHRDHEVVDTGLYRWVRHPAYSGAIVPYVGIGLALGNWISLVLTTASALAGYGYRVRVEERYLRRELEGYEAYVEETPYRLVPFVW